MQKVKFGSVMRFVVGSAVASHVGGRSRSRKVKADKVAALCMMFQMAERLPASASNMDYWSSRMPYDVWEVAALEEKVKERAAKRQVA
jgi:hypothetical protein